MEKQIEIINAAIEKHKDSILETERYIWQHPETGYKEYETSEYLADIFKKLGYDPNVDMNLFKECTKQGLEKNIEKFKNLANKETKALQKVLQNKKTFEKLQASKFILSTAIPVFLMGYCLPIKKTITLHKLYKIQKTKIFHLKETLCQH